MLFSSLQCHYLLATIESARADRTTGESVLATVHNIRPGVYIARRLRAIEVALYQSWGRCRASRPLPSKRQVHDTIKQKASDAPESVGVNCAIGEFVGLHEKAHIVEEAGHANGRRHRRQCSHVERFAVAQDGRHEW